MTKPYEISRHLVWKAYQQVKAKKGAAGIDRETIQEFEKDLKGNLYKLWNRMSSGSYFPPPVKGVGSGKPRTQIPPNFEQPFRKSSNSHSGEPRTLFAT